VKRPRWWHKAEYRFNNWRRHTFRRRTAAVPLEQVQHRIELFLTALYGRPLSVATFGDHRRRNAVVRALVRRRMLIAPPMATHEGDAVLLPAELAPRAGLPVLSTYRLLALEQAERIVRHSADLLPTDALERDLYLLREGATIDARLARAHRGLSELLARERRDSMDRRPHLDALPPLERAVESRLREVLSAQPEAFSDPSASPADSLAWAREAARTLRALGGTYRGVNLAHVWGMTSAASEPDVASDEIELERRRSRRRSGNAQTSQGTAPRPGAASKPNEQDARTQSDGPRQPEPSRVTIPDARGDSAATVTNAVQRGSAAADLPPPVFYDEWNVDRGSYARRAVAVRVHQAPRADGVWARAATSQYASLVHHIRHQFERLRARRSMLRRQRAGADLDIDAYVAAMMDRGAGRPLDDRLYIDTRPARRGLAIALLIDASSSTAARLNDSQRIIDVERLALLLASEALSALGDPYAMYSFGGEGASNVRLSVVKDFTEPNDQDIRERIGAIEPGGHTRLGAAIRHVTAQLAGQDAGHRLLLMLSDGRPHDVDAYQDRYGIEDTRHAVLEARASGVFPYCITVDSEAAEYLPRLFGLAGYSVVRRPQQLATALIKVVNSLLA
jgi:nitric oxide reductase NorD protein